jgi:hypothetical protein
MKNYRIIHSHGPVEVLPAGSTYQDALDRVRMAYTRAVVGHDGDISQGGQVTLAWRDEETAAADDGSRAVCMITLHTVDVPAVIALWMFSF